MKSFLLRFCLILICIPGFSQKFSSEETKFLRTYQFDPGFVTPAKKKPSTVILQDGTEYVGNLDKIKYKKNHINFVSIKDSVSGKTIELPADKIKEAYFHPSAMEKFSRSAENATRIATRKATKKMKGDEAIFQTVTVGLKNKKKKDALLLQLLNPDFDDALAFYFDPLAKESKGGDIGGGIGAGLGVQGLGGVLKVGGGVLESYYVKKGDKMIWLRKKDLKKQYDFLFGDNPEFMARYPYKAVKWRWISSLVMEYNRMAQEKLSATR